MKPLHDKLSTEVIHRLCATPNSTLNRLLNLTGLVRWFRLKRAAEAGSSQGRNRLMGKVYAIAALLSITTTLEANAANYSIDHLKLYSHSRFITKESRWSYSARNGSHFGLGQMRSTWYRDLDPYRQIDASLRYITKRYQTPCKAWAWHIERNWY